jgi:hypothetical protein
MEKKTDLYYLTTHLIKNTDLPEFIETESGIDLKWNHNGTEAVCACPMPDHSETQPSFHITLMDEETWVYHCFGCQAKGTIIHFCRDYFGLRNKIEAINYLIKYYKVEGVEDLILQGIKNVSKKVNFERQIENANILTSNQCRMLLRKDYKKHAKWVGWAYKQLNKALADMDYEEVERIGYSASKRMRE